MKTRTLLATTALTGVLCVAALPTAASAANFVAKPLKCEDHPGCFALLIDARIEPDDGKKFEEVVKKNDVKMAVIVLNSPGGNLVAGYAIGNLIHEKGYATYVAGGATCGSVCAMIWMAGSPRQVEPKARIGFHAAYTTDKKGRVIGESGMGNALVGSYYAHLGLSDSAIMYLTSASPKEAKWLNPADAKKYNIAIVERSDKQPYLLGPSSKTTAHKAASNDNPQPSWPTPPIINRQPAFCVAVVDPPGRFLILREGPGAQFTVVGTTGTVGKIEADAIDGEWTHLVNRGWVRTQYVQPCDGREAPETAEQLDPRVPSTGPTGSPQDDMGRFVSKVLGSTELQWKQIFAKDGKIYRPPVLVLYRGATHASCGGAAQSAMRPFYCPADQKIYLDTSFFDQIVTRLRGCEVRNNACQFAQAYVIAHLVGRHVQNLLGILPKAQQAQRAADSKAAANHIQVQVELQADCLAGIWANRENEMLKSEGKPPFIEPGDVEAALRTAAAIGDDTLQPRAQGYVGPDSFTHGSSEQRQRWFNTGFRSGSVASCNTFAAAQL